MPHGTGKDYVAMLSALSVVVKQTQMFIQHVGSIYAITQTQMYLQFNNLFKLCLFT